MKLYTHPGTCSSAAHISLAESGIDYEIVKVDIKGDRILPDGRHLNDVNPKGYVPSLEYADGKFLTENVAILQYIADQSPDSGLAPANGTMERYELQSWLGYVNSEVHKTFGAMFNPALPEEMKGPILEKNATQLRYIDGHLADRKFLMGDDFSVADAYLFITLSWMPGFGVDLSNYPNLAAYEARIAERESVKTVKAA